MVSVTHPTAFIGAAVFLISAAAFLWKGRSIFTGFNAELAEFSFSNLYLTLFALVPLTAGTSYLFMAYGLGFIPVNGTEISFIRYYEWSITTPIIIFGIMILTQTRPLVAAAMAADYAMILTGFFAAISTGTMKYAWFAGSAVCFLALMYLMFQRGSDAFSTAEQAEAVLYRKLRLLVAAMFSLYPVIWLLSSDGVQLLSLSTSLTLFMVLDIVTKIGFLGVLTRHLSTNTIIQTT